MTNFIDTYQIDKDICFELIKYHHKNSEYKHTGMTTDNNGLSKVDKDVKDSVDVEFYNSSNDETIKYFFKILTEAVLRYMEKYYISAGLRTSITNLIQYYPPNGGYKSWHCERSSTRYARRQLAYMVYLNDVPDGGTEWLHQNFKLEAKVGTLVIWPSDFTHTHRGIISKDHSKYIVTGWFEIQ